MEVSRVVTVRDTTLPTIELNGPPVITLECGEEFVDPGVSVSDTCDAGVSDRVTISGDTVNTANVGDYFITYTAEDSSGNQAQRGRVVRVAGNCAGEGEGEGEGEGDAGQQTAQAIMNAFDTLDISANGGLSLTEVQGIFAAFTQAEFDILDTNFDGEVTREELEIAGAVRPAKGGCRGRATKTVSSVKDYIGDLFLLGLLTLTLVAWRRFH
jgi:hypothetical protein